MAGGDCGLHLFPVYFSPDLLSVNVSMPTLR
jgi:hypothetical protein